MDKNYFKMTNYAPYGSNIASYPFGVRLVYQDTDFIFVGG